MRSRSAARAGRTTRNVDYRMASSSLLRRRKAEAGSTLRRRGRRALMARLRGAGRPHRSPEKASRRAKAPVRDRPISTFVGQAASWLIIALTLIISYEVFSRYALGTPHAWVFDVSNMLYGALFMLAGAYTLAKRGHVRGDILYGFLSPRVQAGIDLVLYLLFFFPGVIALASSRHRLLRGLARAERAFVDRGRRAADLPVQGLHSRGGRLAAAAGRGRGDPLRGLSRSAAPGRRARMTWRKWMWTSSSQMVSVRTCWRHRRSRTKLRPEQYEEHRAMRQGTVVRPVADGAGAVGAVFVLTPSPADSTNGHLGLLMLALIVVAIMLGFPTAFTLMGMGVLFACLALRACTSTTRRSPCSQTLDLMVQRAYAAMTNDCADLDPAVRVHGLPGRARQPDREAVPLAAPGDGAHSGLARGGHAGDLRDLRHRHRHRGRGGHADGPAGRCRPCCKAGYSVRLTAGAITAGGCLGILHSALGDADRVRRHRRRVGGAALRRGVLPGHHAGGALHGLRDRHGQAAARPGAAAARGRARRGAAARGSATLAAPGRLARRAGHAVGPVARAAAPARYRRGYLARNLGAGARAAGLLRGGGELGLPRGDHAAGGLRHSGRTAAGPVLPTRGPRWRSRRSRAGWPSRPRKTAGLAEPPGAEGARRFERCPPRMPRPAPSEPSRDRSRPASRACPRRRASGCSSACRRGAGRAVFYCAARPRRGSKSSRCCWRSFFPLAIDDRPPCWAPSSSAWPRPARRPRWARWAARCWRWPTGS